MKVWKLELKSASPLQHTKEIEGSWKTTSLSLISAKSKWQRLSKKKKNSKIKEEKNLTKEKKKKNWIIVNKVTHMYKVAKLWYLWQFTWENMYNSFFLCVQGNSFDKRAYTYLRRPCTSERLTKGTNLRNRQKNRKRDGKEEADGVRENSEMEGSSMQKYGSLRGAGASSCRLKERSLKMLLFSLTFADSTNWSWWRKVIVSVERVDDHEDQILDNHAKIWDDTRLVMTFRQYGSFFQTSLYTPFCYPVQSFCGWRWVAHQNGFHWILDNMK